MKKFGLNEEEFEFFSLLNSPEKIQDWIDKCDYNFCKNGYVCKPPIKTIRERNAHCFEGALFAATAFRVNGKKPLIMEFGGVDNDIHLIAPFQDKGLWGAVAQSQYFTLKYRDPIFRTFRELALSYFPVYSDGEAITLRDYTHAIDLSQFDYLNWVCCDVGIKLGDRISEKRHFSILPAGFVPRKIPREMDLAMRQHKKN